FDLLLVDLNSVRSTAIALHRNLRRSPELEDLRLVWLHGEETVPAELSQAAHSMLLPRVTGMSELRSALTSFLAAQASPRAAVSEDIPMPQESPEPAVASVADAQARASAGKLRGRVLLVEDNPVNLMVAQRLVGLLGLHCETADNGEKALERMAQGNLDLVLMDCQMPVKDGYTASREWREHEVRSNLPRLPIIAMTANAMAGDRQKCLDAGMDDYLSKPVDRRLLEATVARWLSHRHAAAAPASLPATDAPAAATLAAKAPAPPAPAASTPAQPSPARPVPAPPAPVRPAAAPAVPAPAARPVPPSRPTMPAAPAAPAAGRASGREGAGRRERG